MLDALADALHVEWHDSRAAGRVERHLKLLREIARQLSTDPQRPDRPDNSAQAETQIWDHLMDLQRSTPRHGLSSATAEFVDHLVEMFGRYAQHLFVCFDDARIPATTNGLEGYFGQIKRMIRKALGAGSTTNSVVGNLGAEFLLAWQQVRRSAKGKEFPSSIDLPAYHKARAELEALEQPARQRRSCLRDPGNHLLRLLDRWLSSD